MTLLSSLLLPSIFAIFGLYAMLSKRDLSSSFLEGARDGMKSAFSLLPTLTLLLSAVSMFSASGATELLSEWLSPLLSKCGIPAELTPLFLVRPLSGSGSTALLTDLYETHGPDSFVSKCASVLTASSDTVVYVIAVYMSAANVKKTRHALPAALLTMLFGIVLSSLLVGVFEI